MKKLSLGLVALVSFVLAIALTLFFLHISEPEVETTNISGNATYVRCKLLTENTPQVIRVFLDQKDVMTFQYGDTVHVYKTEYSDDYYISNSPANDEDLMGVLEKKK